MGVQHLNVSMGEAMVVSDGSDADMPYSNSSDCYFVFKAPMAEDRVHLSFTRFDVEHDFDYVKVCGKMRDVLLRMEPCLSTAWMGVCIPACLGSGLRWGVD